VGYTVTTGSATISTTEYFLMGGSTTASYQTTDAKVSFTLDMSAMAAGDQYEIKAYEKVDGTNARVIYRATLTGAQTDAWASPELALAVGWEISLDRLAGTDRSIKWTIYTITAA
jgi:hypothetical protein